MKTPKSIVVVLFVLLTAQIASAYYCPSTGRWLSRDPIGEPGFQTSQMATVAPSRWINRDSIQEKCSKNVYGFVLNNPADYVDVLGLDSEITIVEFPDLLLDPDAARALAQKIAKCDLIWAAYKALGNPTCKACTTRAEVLKTAAKLTAIIAGRREFLDLKCDYCLPGSIAAGSAVKEKNHQDELRKATEMLLKCAIVFSSLPRSCATRFTIN